jgi:1-acyl-sn-glycerol-3-phosphate acyltransferase
MITRRILPGLRALIEGGYFSFEVEGAEHVPLSGPMVYAANHGARFSIDSLFGALAVADYVALERLPYGAVLDQMLKIPVFGRFLEAIGAFPVSWMRDPESIPAAMEVFSVQPEGAAGNRKPFWQPYQMREWKSGFVRLALARRAQIVPIALIGGEECMPALGSLRFVEPLLEPLPLPLTLVPLPSRWKLVFHPPIRLEPSRFAKSDDPEQLKRAYRTAAAEVQAIVQQTLDRETANHWRVRLVRRYL